MTAELAIKGREHWTKKGSVRLFLWEKTAGASPGPLGTVLFVHGSSMGSQPHSTFRSPAAPTPPPWTCSHGSGTTPGA